MHLEGFSADNNDVGSKQEHDRPLRVGDTTVAYTSLKRSRARERGNEDARGCQRTASLTPKRNPGPILIGW